MPTFEEIFRDVVRENGQPVVLSPYGFKIMEVDGKKFMCCMTKEEWEKFCDIHQINHRPDDFCWMSSPGHCYGDCGGGPNCVPASFDNGATCGCAA
jgi:hypothetical protein